MQGVAAWPFALRRLPAESPADGADAMDAISWVIYGKHGNTPECVCPVIAAYVGRGCYLMPEGVRHRLLPYLPRIAGSHSQQHEAARVRILQLAALRVFAPRALDTAGMHEHAASLREMPDDVDMRIAGKVADAARAAARVAGVVAAAWAAGLAARAAGLAVRRAGVVAAADAAVRAADAARAAAAAGAWDDYFEMLDAALSAGPQGAPWTAEMVERGVAALASAGGMGKAV